jgi:hypothetical protein
MPWLYLLGFISRFTGGVYLVFKWFLIIALFIVGIFEWVIVYFTNWQKQVKIAYARYSPLSTRLTIRMEEDSRAEEAVVAQI